jgi:hypothetical protein
MGLPKGFPWPGPQKQPSCGTEPPPFRHLHSRISQTSKSASAKYHKEHHSQPSIDLRHNPPGSRLLRPVISGCNLFAIPICIPGWGASVIQVSTNGRTGLEQDISCNSSARILSLNPTVRAASLLLPSASMVYVTFSSASVFYYSGGPSIANENGTI